MSEATVLEGKDPPARLELSCTTCGSPMPFVQWLTKPGKNGKPSIWPQYEGCKNPECRVGRRNLGTSTPEDTGSFFVRDGHYEPDHHHAPGWRGTMYQYPPLSWIAQELEGWKDVPDKILMPAEDIREAHIEGGLFVKGKVVEVQIAKGMTPGYRYFAVPFDDVEQEPVHE